MNHIAKQYRYIIISWVIFLCSLSTQVVANSNWKAPDFLEGATLISAEDLIDIKKTLPNIVIIDTRDIDTAEATIEGAVPLTNKNTNPNSLRQLIQDKSTPVVFFGTGEKSIKSYKAAKKTISYGYVTVFWMRGGIEEWKKKGMPLTGAGTNEENVETVEGSNQENTRASSTTKPQTTAQQ